MATGNINQDLASKFREISQFYITKRDTYRARTYSNAADKIENHTNLITSGKQAQDEIKGIGKSVATDIDSYINTGKIPRLEELRTSDRDRTQVLDLYTKIYGIGPVKANELYEYGFRTIEDLLRAPLTDAQKMGVHYFYQLVQRIRREEIQQIEDVIRNTLTTTFYNITWIIAGSYRRGEPTSGDVDILIRGDPGITIPSIVNSLTRSDLLTGQLALGETKFMGIGRLDDQHNAHRIDIFVLPTDEWAYATLYATGSQRFNVLMRQRALEFGLTMNEHEMKNINTGQKYLANTEEDIFNYLRVQYIPPVERVRNLSTLTYV